MTFVTDAYTQCHHQHWLSSLTESSLGVGVSTLEAGSDVIPTLPSSKQAAGHHCTHSLVYYTWSKNFLSIFKAYKQIANVNYANKTQVKLKNNLFRKGQNQPQQDCFSKVCQFLSAIRDWDAQEIVLYFNGDISECSCMQKGMLQLGEEQRAKVGKEKWVFREGDEGPKRAKWGALSEILREEPLHLAGVWSLWDVRGKVLLVKFVKPLCTTLS